VLELEFWLLVLMVAGSLLGAWGIVWAHNGHASQRASWGRRLFVIALLSLAATSLVAAFHRADALVFLGLAAGLLTAGMLWEGPSARWQGLAPDVVPEET
jgi:hypothetical protein